MDIDHAKPHHTTPTTSSELFICFTSRLSHSSSMRHSSKSILSSSSSTTAPTSSSATLTTSLSRRLRHNGSLRRGAQSPAMFPPSNKKSRGSAFSENPEPSSPKVTCIGQVRVKTKKQGKKMKLRACRKKISGPGPGPGTETGFRLMDPGSDTQLSISGNNQECGLQQRNQSWVHLPLTICEALSCLLPCKASCFSNGKERENGGCGGERDCNDNNNVGSSGSCGAVFRWLVSSQEGEGKRRDIELVVGDDVEEREKERGRVVERECSRRRSIFDDMEFDDLFKDNNVDMDDNDGGCEEKGRVSVCVPPKNALLLMRCRSDPLKMASLSQKYWEPAIVVDDGGDDVDVDVDDDDGEEEVKHEVCDEKVDGKEKSVVGEVETEEVGEESVKLEVGSKGDDEMCEDLGGVEGVNDDLGVCVEEQVVGDEEDLGVCVEEQVVGDEEDLGGVEGLNDDLGACGEEQVVGVEEVTEQEQEVEEVEKNVEGVEEEEQDEKDVIFEETQMIEDEIQTIGSVIELGSAEEQCKDVEIEQDLVNNDYERVEIEQDFVNNESCYEEEKFEDAQNEQNLVNDSFDQGLQMEEEELERAESSEGSSCSTVTSSSSSPDESTAESGADEEEKHTVQVKVVARKSVEKTAENESKFEENEQEYQSDCEEKEQNYQSKCVEKEQEKTNNKPMLPDCLLLMMREPKLSMEVSKETWVCSTDFVQWLPDRHPAKKPTKGGHDKKSSAVVPAAAQLPPQPRAPQPAYQPGRSSISFPASGVVEQKLAKASVGYEPSALTRCKSAPHRSTAKISGPELACSLWGRENGRKLEPHRQATCVVGKAGVGF